MVIGVPVVDHHELTQEMVHSLVNTVKNPETFTLVIIDNNSELPYTKEEFIDIPFTIVILPVPQNIGYYYPLRLLYDAYKPTEEIIGLMHNDVYIWEEGWNVRLLQAFKNDAKLGLVGFAGSNQADALGGRGGGTMLYFRGEKGQSQAAGQRVYDLHPAVLLDSLFMAFRTEAISQLGINEHIAPCHFYDKIWSIRTIEQGWHVAVLGIEIDHMGGMTEVLPKYTADAQRWCEEEGIPIENNDPKHTIYLEAERRFLAEYRDEKHFIPCRVLPTYELWHS